MQARQLALSDNDIQLLIQILNDNNYWVSLKARGPGVPKGIGEIKALIAKHPHFDADALNQLAEIATKRLRNHDTKRQMPTELVYKLFASTDSDPQVVAGYFNQLNIHHKSYLNLLKVCPSANITVDAYKMLDPAIMNRLDYNPSHSDREEYGENQCSLIHRWNFLISQCKPYQPKRVPNDPLALIQNTRAYYRVNYPNLIRAFDSYIVDIYSHDETLFMMDNSNFIQLVKTVDAVSPRMLRVPYESKHGKGSAHIDNDENYATRGKSILCAALSPTYFVKIFGNINAIATFISLMEKRNKVFGPNFMSEMTHRIFNLLTIPEIYNQFAFDAKEASHLEEILPGVTQAYRVSRVSEMKKNANVMMLARSKNHSLFGQLPRDIIKEIAVRTVPPKSPSGGNGN